MTFTRLNVLAFNIFLQIILPIVGDIRKHFRNGGAKVKFLLQNERQRLMRRNIVRYAVLAYVITLQRVSLRVKKRFPTWQHVVDSGKKTI